MFWIALPGDLSAIPTYDGVDTVGMPRISRREEEEEDGQDEAWGDGEEWTGKEEGTGTNGKIDKTAGKEKERQYIPVGHINLDHEDFAGKYYGLTESCGLTEPDGSVLTLTLLFVRLLSRHSTPSPFL